MTEQTARGIRHTMEPEADSLSFIDFEDDDQGYVSEVVKGDAKDAENWYVESALSLLGEAGVPATHEELAEDFQLQGSELFWSNVIDRALDAGFEVYDSETRTELFSPGTRCDDDECACWRRPEAEGLVPQIRVEVERDGGTIVGVEVFYGGNRVDPADYVINVTDEDGGTWTL